MYYAITNEFCANKPHHLRRSETMEGMWGQTNLSNELAYYKVFLQIFINTVKSKNKYVFRIFYFIFCLDFISCMNYEFAIIKS